MQTEKNVAQDIPLWYTIDSSAQLHEQIISDSNFLLHELCSSQKSTISKLKALFINGTKIYLSQYKMFWKVPQHPDTYQYFLVHAPLIEEKLRCMQDLAEAADYNQNYNESEDTIYTVLSKNFMYLSTIFVCPYMNFFYWYGILNVSLLRELNLKHFAATGTMQQPIEKFQTQVAEVNATLRQHHGSTHVVDSSSNGVTTDVHLAAPSDAGQRISTQPPPAPETARSWAAVVGGFLNPDTVPGLSPQTTEKKVTSAKVKKVNAEHAEVHDMGSAVGIANRRAEIEALMAVAESLPDADRQQYLDDLQSNLHAQSTVLDKHPIDEEEELPRSMLAHVQEVDADGFTLANGRRKGKKNKGQFKSPVNQVVLTEQAEQYRQSQAELEEGDSLEYEEPMRLVSPEQNQIDPEEDSAQPVVYPLVAESSTFLGNNVPYKLDDQRNKKDKKHTKRKTVAHSQLSPIEQLKKIITNSGAVEKWNAIYQTHTIVTKELEVLVIEKLTTASEADAVAFINAAKLSVAILLAILQHDKSTLNVRKLAFTKLMVTDDYVGFYLYIELQQSLLILRSKFIATLEAQGNISQEEKRKIVQGAMSVSETMLPLVAHHIDVLIDGITDKGKAEELAKFAKHTTDVGQTPLMRLLQKFKEKGTSIKYAIVHHLLPVSDIFAKDNEGRTALHYALMYYNADSSPAIVVKLIQAMQMNKADVAEPFVKALGPDVHGNSFLHNFVMAVEGDNILSDLLAILMQQIPTQLLGALLHANRHRETIFFLLDKKPTCYKKSINLLCQFMVHSNVMPNVIKLISARIHDKHKNVYEGLTIFAPRDKDPLVELVRDLCSEELSVKGRKNILQRILWIMEWRHALRYNIVPSATDNDICALDQFIPHDELVHEQYSTVIVPEIGELLAHEALVMFLLEAEEDIQNEFAQSGAFGFYEANSPYNTSFLWHVMSGFVIWPTDLGSKYKDAKYNILLKYLKPILNKRDIRGVHLVEYAIVERNLELFKFFASYDEAGATWASLGHQQLLNLAFKMCYEETIETQYMIELFVLLLREKQGTLQDAAVDSDIDINILFLPVKVNFDHLLELFIQHLKQKPEELTRMLAHRSAKLGNKTVYEYALARDAECVEDSEKMRNKAMCILFENIADELDVELSGREQAQASSGLTLTM